MRNNLHKRLLRTRFVLVSGRIVCLFLRYIGKNRQIPCSETWVLVGQIGGIPDLQGARSVETGDLCVTDVRSEGDRQQSVAFSGCAVEDLAVLAGVRGVVTAGHIAMPHAFEYGELLDVVPECVVIAIVPERVVLTTVPERIVITFVPERIAATTVPERI